MQMKFPQQKKTLKRISNQATSKQMLKNQFKWKG